MNERIKLLAEQASHQSPDGYPVTIPYSKDFAEKFAELIVRECIELNNQELSFNAFERLLNKYQDHFGVEL